MLKKLRDINFYNLKEIDKAKLKEELSSLKINLQFHPFFNSEFTEQKVSLINAELDNVIGSI
jgi:hypothetical protein